MRKLLAAFAFVCGSGLAAKAQVVTPGLVLPAASGSPHVCASTIADPHPAIADFQIGEDGTPKAISIVVSSGSADLDKAAAACITAWRYKPATLNGAGPYALSWNATLSWKRDTSGNPITSSPVPGMEAMEPMIHRLTIDTHMQGPLSTVLKLTQNNAEWRCRQVFLDIKDEHFVRHWISQGWDDPDDLVYARTDNGYYIAIHVLADGTFVTAVSIDDRTGKGIRLRIRRCQGTARPRNHDLEPSRGTPLNGTGRARRTAPFRDVSLPLVAST